MTPVEHNQGVEFREQHHNITNVRYDALDRSSSPLRRLHIFYILLRGCRGIIVVPTATSCQAFGADLQPVEDERNMPDTGWVLVRGCFVGATLFFII